MALFRKVDLFFALIVILTQTIQTAALSDAIASVDKLFAYKIEDGKYSDNIELFESGHSSLPSWLTYDPLSRTMMGVPREQDRGTYIISADGDLFAITVSVDTQSEVAQPVHSPDRPIICKPKDAVTQVKVTLNTDVSLLKPEQKVKLVRDLSTHLALHDEHISLRAQTQSDLLDSTSALVSGLGDQKKKPYQPSSMFYWVVGCGPVRSHQMETLERLESTAKDGSLSRSLGHGVTGWQVTINRQKAPVGKRRLKRGVVVTATPTPDGTTPDGVDRTSSSTSVTPTATTMRKESSVLKPLPITTPSIKPTGTPTTKHKTSTMSQPKLSSYITTSKATKTSTSTAATTPATTTTTTTTPTTTTATTTPMTTPTTPTTTSTTTPTTTSTTTPTTTITTTPTTTTTTPTTTTTTTTPTTPITIPKKTTTYASTTTTSTSPTSTTTTVTTAVQQSTGVYSEPDTPTEQVTVMTNLPDGASSGGASKPSAHSSSTTLIRTSRSALPGTSPMPAFLTTPPIIPPPPSPTMLARPKTSSPIPSETMENIEGSVTDDPSRTANPAFSTSQPPTMPPPPITPPPPRRNGFPTVNSTVRTPIRLNMTSGELYKWDIPRNLFSDPDGDVLKYFVVDLSTSEDVSTNPASWLKFDSVNERVLAVPLKHNYGTSKFILRAEDGNGGSADVHLTMFVRDNEFGDIAQIYLMTLGLPFSGSNRDTLEVVFELDKKFPGRAIKVEDVTHSVIKFGISSSFDGASCPNSANREDLTQLRKLKELDLEIFSGDPKLPVISVRSRPRGSCKNSPPRLGKAGVVNNFLVNFTAVNLGELFELQVPLNLFKDQEDINLEHMELEMFFGDVEVTNSETSWIHLNPETKTILGFPFGILGNTQFQYVLKAKDSGRRYANLDIDVQVIDPTYTEPSNLFTVVIKGVFSQFDNNVKDQIGLINKLKDAFSKFGKPKIQVKSMKKGSIVIQFHLYDTQSPDQDNCEKVGYFRDEVFTPDNKVNSEFVDSMAPYRLEKVAFIGHGACDSLEGAEAIVKYETTGEVTTNGTPVNILYIVLPILILVVVIIIIIIIMVFVRRKKQNSHDVSKSNGTYIEKGVPVVFEEDIQNIDKTEPTENEPLMEEQNQPKPPAYPQNGEAEMTPLNTDHKSTEPSADVRYPTPPISEHDDTDR